MTQLPRLGLLQNRVKSSEITLKGRILAVGGIQQKIRAAYDAGIKGVLLPQDNIKEAQGLPPYIIENIKLTPVHTIEEVLKYALIDATVNVGR